MSKRPRFPNEFRWTIVQEYYNNQSYGFKRLAKKYGINPSTIQNWIHLYDNGGIATLFKSSQSSYSGEFKIYAVEYMHQHSLSVRQASAYFHISSHTTLLKWERIYFEEGKDGLLKERRGKSNKVSGVKEGRPPKKDVNENEDLLAENQRLRMENEYLKKLIALTQEREKKEQKTK